MNPCWFFAEASFGAGMTILIAGHPGAASLNFLASAFNCYLAAWIEAIDQRRQN